MKGQASLSLTKLTRDPLLNTVANFEYTCSPSYENFSEIFRVAKLELSIAVAVLNECGRAHRTTPKAKHREAE